MNTSNNIICKNLTFRYAHYNPPILKNLNLVLKSNTITLITGSSGCGKSTLCHLLGGLYPEHAGFIETGNITLGNKELNLLPAQERAKWVGMMFQNPNLQFCTDTVYNELIFCLENINYPPQIMDEVIDTVLVQTEILHLKQRRLHQLSGGEKQRVALACTLAIHPKWLILDEPFANLDPDSTIKLIKLLANLKKEYNLSIVVVDHQIAPWINNIDEIIILGLKGTLLQQNIMPKNINNYKKQFKQWGIGFPKESYSPKPLTKPNKTPIILQMKSISVQYNRPILCNLSANFEKGKIHAIIGKSGSGKSTLLQVLCGNIAYNGDIFINKCSIHGYFKHKKAMKKMAFIFQDPQDQFVTYKVYDELANSLKQAGINKQQLEKHTQSYLTAIGLWEYRHVSPYMLSQGQQRRLAVAAILCLGHEIIICDEPTYAQDIACVRKIMALFQQQVYQNETTILLITHDYQLAHDYADTIYHLQNGKLRLLTEVDIYALFNKSII